VPLLEATAGQLLAWRRSLTVAPDTVGQYVGHVRAFYSWAIRAGVLLQDPARWIPVPPATRRLPRPAPEAAVMTAVRTAPPRVRPWLVLAGWAGLRAKQIALLRRECVLDALDPPLLLVAADATKGRSERLVPLSAFTLAELAACGMPARGWVFLRRDGQAGPNRPLIISRLSNEHLAGCGLGVTLHQFRHWFGTQTYRSSLDIRVVQELLGHSSPAMAAKYAAFSRSSAAAAVAALPVPPRRQPLQVADPVLVILDQVREPLEDGVDAAVAAARAPQQRRGSQDPAA
jgi:integrase/recombinase XerC/integrase/recombinase XerD